MWAQREEAMSFETGVEAFHAKNYATAVSEWEKAAGDGDADSSFQLGLMYANGTGVERDYMKAHEWFSHASERDHVEAEYSLGVLYNVGFGVERDEAEAAYWYTRAAEKGNAQAQCNLAGLYETGEGVTRDYLKAVELYTASAKQGYVVAIFNLVQHYIPPDATCPGSEQLQLRFLSTPGSETIPKTKRTRPNKPRNLQKLRDPFRV